MGKVEKVFNHGYIEVPEVVRAPLLWNFDLIVESFRAEGIFTTEILDQEIGDHRKIRADLDVIENTILSIDLTWPSTEESTLYIYPSKLQGSYTTSTLPIRTTDWGTLELTLYDDRYFSTTVSMLRLGAIVPYNKDYKGYLLNRIRFDIRVTLFTTDENGDNRVDYANIRYKDCYISSITFPELTSAAPEDDSANKATITLTYYSVTCEMA